MTTPKRTRTLDRADAAYIAGLLDGEGTITLTRVHRNENRRLVVSISNNELPLLKFVHDAFAVGKITRKRHYKDEHQPSYTFQVTSRQAIDVLRQLTPFLRSYKRGRAELALQAYTKLTPRNGRYTPDLAAARLDFERQLLALKPVVMMLTIPPLRPGP